jgi:anti-anti-sigma factor
MSEVFTRRSHLLKSRSEQGVLILTITAPHLGGDALVQELGEELSAAVNGAQAPKVVLDFKPVTALASAGFRPLLSLRRKIEERGGQLVLCNMAPVVEQAWRATRLISTSRSSTAAFELQPNLAAAIASLTPADA